MAVFKCKMCGGSLKVTPQTTIMECEYCGTQQTLPKLDDDRRANLYDRANHFRRNNEFDKAMGIYETILNEDTSDAEAYWSLVLCRYGIEYVEDPISHKRIPTVNRTQFTSVFDDDNYKSALHYADSYQKTIYEAEAKAINEIQKNILTISQNEEHFDVFVCYKETDNNGRRTPDSVLAQELYYQLVEEGFKVFFSRITLEDKIGNAYEPYIFAALNSAKVMVVLGTKPEFFNAVWVKNEWSRYLSLIKQGQRKMLIPAYKDMDPYDLPEEFSHLQAQDMSRLGFMQDLIHGIKKIIGQVQPSIRAPKEIFVTNTNTPIAPLLERAFMFLEDGDWDSANEQCEKVLDLDPKNAQAYIGKLMAELHIKVQDDLKEQAEPFDNNKHYQKALRFADENLKSTLADYIEQIKTRIEHERLNCIYGEAYQKMRLAYTQAEYEDAHKLFSSIRGWRDADKMILQCENKMQELRAKAEAERLDREHRAEIARIKAKKQARINNIIALIIMTIVAIGLLLDFVVIPNSKYNEAIALMDAGKYSEAISAFEALDGYKDSTAKVIECKYNDAIALMNAGRLDEAYNIFLELGVYKDAVDKVGDIRLTKTKEQLKNIKVGSYINFGAYEQDNNTSNGKEDIKWLVLEVKDGKALVISKYALDYKPYNASYTDVTWETCTLRKWLNNDFLGAAFSAGEQAIIPTVTVSADKNPDYSTNPGNATHDQVFLLSIPEANKYFSSDSARLCKPTDYAVANGAYVGFSSGNCYWWLRSPGDGQNRASSVRNDGDVTEYGYYVGDDDNAVRPALWIDLGA